MFNFSTWLRKFCANMSRNMLRRIAARRRTEAERRMPPEERVVPAVDYPTDIVYHPPVGPYQFPSPPSGSYGPNDIQTAYGINGIVFPGGVVGDGTGQTMAVVDAYDDPSFVSSVNANGSSNAAAFAGSDLAKFDPQYGLPDPPTFLKVNQSGVNGSYPGVDSSGGGKSRKPWTWSGPTIAPKATIILVESDSPSTLFTAVQTASTLQGVTVVSMSFGGSDNPGTLRPIRSSRFLGSRF